MAKISRNLFVFFILIALMLSTANLQAFSNQKSKAIKIEKATTKSDFILKSVTIEAVFNAIVGDFHLFNISFQVFNYKHIIYRSIKIIDPMFENIILKILFSRIIPTQAP